MPIDDIASILALTHQHLLLLADQSSRQRSQKNMLKLKVEQFIAFVKSVNESNAFRQYRRQLELVDCGSDLTATESIDIESNAYLCARMSSNVEFARMKRVAFVVNKVALRFHCAKLRMETVYVEQTRSLIGVVRRMSSNMSGVHLQSVQAIKSPKFCVMVKEFFERFMEDLVTCLLSKAVMSEVNSVESDEEEIEALVGTVMGLIEKFFMICSTCVYDSCLTMAYLKYYWNFIKSGLVKIDQVLKK